MWYFHTHIYDRTLFISSPRILQSHRPWMRPSQLPIPFFLMGLRFPWLRRCACRNATCVFLGGPKGGGDGEKKQQKLAFSWHHVLQTLESCVFKWMSFRFFFSNMLDIARENWFTCQLFRLESAAVLNPQLQSRGIIGFLPLGSGHGWLQKSSQFIATSLTSPIVAMMSFWILMDDSMIMFAPKFQIFRWIKPFTGNPVRFTVSTHSPCVSLTMLLLDFEVVIRACQHCRQL